MLFFCVSCGDLQQFHAAVFADADVVDLVLRAVLTDDEAFEVAEGDGVVGAGDAEVELDEVAVFDLVVEVDGAVLVIDAPVVVVIVLEIDRRQAVVLIAEPEDVLVVFFLIDGLVARQIKGQIFFLSIKIFLNSYLYLNYIISKFYYFVNF